MAWLALQTLLMCNPCLRTSLVKEAKLLVGLRHNGMEAKQQSRAGKTLQNIYNDHLVLRLKRKGSQARRAVYAYIEKVIPNNQLFTAVKDKAALLVWKAFCWKHTDCY